MSHTTEPKSPQIFKAMTFNIAHGRGRSFHQALVRRPEMERNLRQIAAQILEHDPHIVGLQEIDQGSFWNHRVDQLAYLQELTRYAHARHGIHKQDTLFVRQLMLRYGVGILSRLEPLDFASQAFSLGRLDSKGFTSKRLLFAGRRLLVICLHLDFQSRERRAVQADQVIRHVESIPEEFDHLVLMGDFNCTLHSKSSVLPTLMEGLNLHTWEPKSRRKHISFPGLLGRRLDYILVDRGLEFVDYRTGDARLSDHEFVIAEIRL